MFDKDNKFGFIINNNNNENNNIKNTDLPCTISSKVLATVPASNVTLDDNITVNNVSFNEDRRYYIEFLGNKKLCSLSVNEEQGNAIACSIGNYYIQAFNNSTNILLFIIKINEDSTTDIFTDLIIYEEEIKYLDNKYLETDLVLQNSISIGRVGNIGTHSSAIGSGVTASGVSSHAEGDTTIASGECSHSEGNSTKAIGTSSHSEGYNTTASGWYAHAEGNSTEASGNHSHSEGYSTTASGSYSHAEGNNTTASGSYSHAEGYWTKASSDSQHVQGKFNVEDTEGKYVHIVGNGKNNSNKSNAHTLDWQGNGWYAGKLSQEGTPTEDKDLVTKKYIDDSGYINEIKILPVEYDNGKIVNVKNLEAHSTYICPNDVDLLDLEYEKESKLVAFLITPNKEQLIYVGNKTDKQIELMVGINSYVIHFKTETQAGSMEKNVHYLTPNNNIAFTPTKDYNPVHKKYVDDKVSNLPQFSFNENGELVVKIGDITKIFVPKE